MSELDGPLGRQMGKRRPSREGTSPGAGGTTGRA